MSNASVFAKCLLGQLAAGHGLLGTWVWVKLQVVPAPHQSTYTLKHKDTCRHQPGLEAVM